MCSWSTWETLEKSTDEFLRWGTLRLGDTVVAVAPHSYVPRYAQDAEYEKAGKVRDERWAAALRRLGARMPEVDAQYDLGLTAILAEIAVLGISFEEAIRRLSSPDATTEKFRTAKQIVDEVRKVQAQHVARDFLAKQA